MGIEKSEYKIALEMKRVSKREDYEIKTICPSCIPSPGFYCQPPSTWHMFESLHEKVLLIICR